MKLKHSAWWYHPARRTVVSFTHQPEFTCQWSFWYQQHEMSQLVRLAAAKRPWLCLLATARRPFAEQELLSNHRCGFWQCYDCGAPNHQGYPRVAYHIGFAVTMLRSAGPLVVWPGQWQMRQSTGWDQVPQLSAVARAKGWLKGTSWVGLILVSCRWFLVCTGLDFWSVKIAWT